MPRLFVAVWPPYAVVEALAEMPRSDADGVRWVARERLHITLRFFGEADEAEAVAALRPLRLPEVPVTLGPTLERLGRGVLMAPAHGLEGLAAAVADATAHTGEPPPDRPFTGHVTVARFKRQPPPGPWPTVQASFTATEFALVRVVQPGQYATVAHFPLH